MLRLAPLAALVAAGTSLRAQTTIQSYPGSVAGGFYGARVANAGDINGDFVGDDIAIAATGANSSAGSVTFVSAATHLALTTLAGSEAGAGFGSNIIGVRDVNLDGYSDVVIASPNYSASATSSGLGRVRLYSGKWIATGTGTAVLGLFTGSVFGSNTSAVGDFLGSGLGNIGEINGDGKDDFAIGARDVGGPGYVLLKSGGSPLAGLGVIFGNAVGDDFGSAITGMGDLDNDGLPEFAIGADQRDNGGRGYVELYETGNFVTPVYTLLGAANGDQFGAALARMPTITNGDAEDEMIVGAPGGNYVNVYNGQTGALVFHLVGDAAQDRFGTSVTWLPDWNGDGRMDILVGAPGSQNPTYAKPGYVRCFSGADGSVLFTLQGDASTAANGASDEFGASMAVLIDDTGDHVRDLVVGAPRHDGGGTDAGLARLCNGKPALPYLAHDLTEVSTAAGGTIHMTMHSDPAQAGMAFFVVGSLSGTTPGFDYQGFHIPLNADGYFNTTVNNVNVPVGGDGFVMATGIGNCSLTFLPNQFPSLIGMTISHAYVVMQNGQMQAVSNPVGTVIAN